MGVRVSWLQHDTAAEPFDVKVSWLQHDTAAEPFDVKVSWLQHDTAAEPFDVKVSWLQHDTAAEPFDVKVSWLQLDTDVVEDAPAPLAYYSADSPIKRLHRQALEEDEVLLAILQMFVMEEA